MPPEDLGSQAQVDNRSSERRLLEQQIAIDAHKHGQESWLAAGINAPLSGLLSTDDVKANKILVDLEAQVKQKEAAGDAVGLQAMDAQIKAAIAADVKAQDATFNATNCSTFLADVVATVPLFMRGGKGRALSAVLTGVNSTHIGDSAGDQFLELATGGARGAIQQKMFESMGEGKFLRTFENPGLKNGAMGYVNRNLSTAVNWDTYKDGFSPALGRISGQAFDVPAIMGDVAIGMLAHGAAGSVNKNFDKILERNAVLGNVFTASVIGTASGAHGEITHQLGNVIFSDGNFDVGAVLKAATTEGFKNALSGYGGAKLDAGPGSMFVPDPDVSPPVPRTSRPPSTRTPSNPTAGPGPIRPESQISLGNEDYRVVSSNPQTVVVEHTTEAHISTGTAGTVSRGSMELNGYVSAGTGKVRVDNVMRDVPLWRRAGTPDPEVFVDLHRLSTPPGANTEVRVQKVDNLIAASTPDIQRVQQQGHWTEPVNRVADLNGVPKTVVGHATERSNRVVVATDAPPPSGTPPTINVAHSDIANYQGVRIYTRDASGTTTTPRTFYANRTGEVFDMALQQDGSYVGTLHPEYRALDAAVTSTVRQPLAANPGTEVRIGSDQATVVAATNNRVILNTGNADINGSINTALAGAPALTGDRMTINYSPAGTMTAEIDNPGGGRTSRNVQLFTSRTNPSEVYVNAADISGTGTPADSRPVRITDLLSRPSNEIGPLSHVSAPSAAWAEPRSHFGEAIRDAAGTDIGTIAGHSQDGSAYVVDSGTRPGTAVRALTHTELQQPRYKPVVVYEADPSTKALAPRVMYADSTLGNRVYEMQARGDGYEAHETNYVLADAALKPYAPEHTVGTKMQIGSREATLQGWDPAHRNAALKYEQTIAAVGRAVGERNGTMTANGFVDSQITVPAVLVPGDPPAMTRLYQSGGKIYADLSDPSGAHSTGKYNPIELQGVVITPEADLDTAHATQKRTPQMDMAQQEIGRQIQDGGSGHRVVGHDLDGRNAVVLSGVHGPSVEVRTVTRAQLNSDYEPVSVRVNGKASDSPVLYYARKGIVAPGSPAPIFEMVPDGNGFKVMSHPELLLRQTQDATGAVEDARDRAEATNDAERRDPHHPDNQARTLLKDATTPGASQTAQDAFKDYIRQNASKIDEEYLRTKHPDAAALRLIDEAYAELVRTGNASRQRVVANPNDLTAQTQFIDWALSVGKDTASRVQLNGDALRPLRERLQEAQNAFDYLYAATTGRDVTTALPKFDETLTNLLSNTSNKLPGQTDAQAMAANYDMRAVLLRAAEHSMEGPDAARLQAIDYINKICDEFGTTKGTELLRRAALPADGTPGDGPTRVTDFIIFASKQSPDILSKFEKEPISKPQNVDAGETSDVDLRRSVTDLVSCARNLNGAYERLVKIAKNIGDVKDFNTYIDNNGKYLFSSLNELIRNSPELDGVQKQRAIGKPDGTVGFLQRAYIAKFPQAAELLSKAASPEGTYDDYRNLIDFVHNNGPDAFLPGPGQTNEQMLLNWVLVNRPEYNMPVTASSSNELVRNSFGVLQYQATMAGRELRAQATGASPNPNINLTEPNFERLAMGAAHWFGGAGGRGTQADYVSLKYDLFDWAAKSNDPYLQQVISKAFNSNALVVPPEGDPIRGSYLNIMGIRNADGSFAHPGKPGAFQEWASTPIADEHGAPIQAGIDNRASIVAGVRATLMKNPALEARMRLQLEQTASGQQHEFLSAALQGVDLPSLFKELNNTPVNAQNQTRINFLYEAIGKRISSSTGVSDFQDFLAHRASNNLSGMTNEQWKFIAQTTSPPPAGRVEPRLAQQFLFPGDQPTYVPVSKAGDAEIIRILSELESNPTLAADIQAPVPNSTAQPLAFRIQQTAGHYLLPNQSSDPHTMRYGPEIEHISVGDVLRGDPTKPGSAVIPLSPERAPQPMSYAQRVAELQKLFENYKPTPPAAGAAPQAPVIRDTTLSRLVELGNTDPSFLARISSEAAGYKDFLSNRNGPPGQPTNRTAFLELVGQLADSGASIEDMNVILDWTRNARLLLAPQTGKGRAPTPPTPDNLRRGTMYRDMADRVINSLVAPDVHMNPTIAIDARKNAMDEADREGLSAWSGGVKGKTNGQNHALATKAFQADVAAAQVLQSSFQNVLN